jgi:membrane-associated phospholipid phosphatase/beta-phosphoglucomutase-like phosphatase (HAD superfamily)
VLTGGTGPTDDRVDDTAHADAGEAVDGDLIGAEEPRPAHHHVAAIAVIVALFAVLAVLVAFGAGGGLDWKIYDAVVSHRRYRLDDFFTPLTNLGSWYIVAPAAILLAAGFAVARRWRDAALLALAPFCALAVNIVLKLIIHRAPPGGDDDDLVAHARYSFPSGHTMTTTALAAALVFIAWPTRWRWPVTAGAVVYAATMGFSRVYVGVHWPSDVIAGWLMGAATTWLVWLALRPRHGRDAVTAPRPAPLAEAESAPGPAPASGAESPVRAVLFDWGNTLMVDDGLPGRMLDRPHVEAVPGAAEALAALHGRYPLYVATNADLSGEAEVLAALDRVGLARFFDGVFSSRDIGARKPESAFYAAALDALRARADARGEPPLRADEVVMVGDNYANDVAGALAAGLRAVWLNPGGAPWPDGRAPERASQIASPADLPAGFARL